MARERLTVLVTHADGRTTRWAPDEPTVENIPSSLTFQTAIPGGFTSCTLSLPREITRDYGDLALFDDVKVLAPGGQVRWHGYVARLPREHADQPRVQVECVGWSGSLTWDKSFRAVYVDPIITGWQGIPTAEIARMAAASLDGATLGAYSPGTSLTLMLPEQAISNNADTQAWYIAPAGVEVLTVQYAGSRTNWPGTWTAPQMIWHVSDEYNAGTSEIESPTLDSTLRYATPATPRRYVSIDTYTGAAATPTKGATEEWTTLAVFGNHGLTRRSNLPDHDGFYASDLIADVVAKQCPFLRTNITTTGFVIPVAVFREPTDAASVIEQVNAYHLYEYGCWTAQDGTPEFFYRMPTDELVWEARLDQGAKLNLEGDDASGWWNGVVVSYVDPWGRERIAAPTGADADTTSDSLLDASESNPVNAHNLGRKWADLRLSNPTTDAGAVQIGAAWLTETNLPQRRGSLTLTGTVNHPVEGAVPVGRVRAGDWIRVADKPGDVARRIVSTSYTHPGQLTCDVGGMPARVESILERIGVSLIGRI